MLDDISQQSDVCFDEGFLKRWKSKRSEKLASYKSSDEPPKLWKPLYSSCFSCLSPLVLHCKVSQVLISPWMKFLCLRSRRLFSNHSPGVYCKASFLGVPMCQWLSGKRWQGPSRWEDLGEKGGALVVAQWVYRQKNASSANLLCIVCVCVCLVASSNLSLPWGTFFWFAWMFQRFFDRFKLVQSPAFRWVGVWGPKIGCDISKPRTFSKRQLAWDPSDSYSNAFFRSTVPLFFDTSRHESNIIHQRTPTFS